MPRTPHRHGRSSAAGGLASDDAVPAPSAAADGSLQVDADWLATIKLHDKIKFRDTRGRRRVLRVVDRDRHGVWAELRRTAYVTNGSRLIRLPTKPEAVIETEISSITPTEGVIRVSTGDLLVLTCENSPGRGPSFDSAGQMLSPARVSCTLPQVFAQAQAGECVCFDDGKITGIAESVSPHEIRVRVRQTPPRGGALKADKGINLPDSKLELPALTVKDKTDLEFIVRHADLVGLSFVNRESDVRELIEELTTKGAGDSGEGRHPLACRDHRCRHGAPRRVRDAEQRTARRCGSSRA